MAIIRGAKENEYVSKLTSPGQSTWIGGIRLVSGYDSSFTWTDGTSLAFSELGSTGEKGGNCLQSNAKNKWGPANCVPPDSNNAEIEKFVCKRGNELGTGRYLVKLMINQI